MTNTELSETPAATGARKRVVFTMGGKGGVGKTAVALALAEWFDFRELPCTLLDLDTENKAVGSLQHYYERASKVNIHTPAGLDAFLDRLAAGDTPIVLADMGAGSGQVACDWFDTMYDDVAGLGIAFTAVGIVTPDPASVDSVLDWASRLQDRVQYLIVENSVSPLADFTYWNRSQQAERFRARFQPVVSKMEFRLPELEHAARQHGLTLARVAARESAVSQLQRTSLVVRAQAYRRRLTAAIDPAAALLVP